MSYCKEQGKDRIIFITKEDHEEPSKVTFSNNDENEPRGLIAADGSINWDCPCLGGMASGPCGVDFREAFSCFHYSKADPKGSDCYDQFATMQDCMGKYPGLYPRSDDPLEFDDIEEEELRLLETEKEELRLLETEKEAIATESASSNPNSSSMASSSKTAS